MGQGGLIQLAAQGVQDAYLTSIPQITFFKVIYRRYTPFAIESVEQSFNNSPGFGRKMNCVLVRAGDLAAQMWLEISLTKSGPTYYPAEALLQEVYFTVGATTYDKHFPLWYRAYDEMYRSAEEKSAYRRCVDFAAEDPIGARKKFYVPLLFTFNRFAGCALPIIGLEFHDLQMFVNLGPAPQGIDATQAPEISMWIDYVFLSQDEREKFAKDQHEYLIDQVQYTGPENATMSTASLKSQQVRLNLNHPVKALLWTLGGPSHGVYTAGPAGTKNDAYAPLKSAKLTLNGSDRFAVRDGAYFNQVQPFQAEGGYPSSGIYTYNFGLKPRDFQPTGTCNFSRIENATMLFTWKQIATAATAASDIKSAQYVPQQAAALGDLNIVGWNLNVFRVAQGMGGVTYVSIFAGLARTILGAFSGLRLF